MILFPFFVPSLASTCGFFWLKRREPKSTQGKQDNENLSEK